MGPHGWYKYAKGAEVLPVTEYFRFAKADSLWGGEGWTLISTRVTPRGTLSALVHGDWAHPSFPGDWNCIVPRHAEIAWETAEPSSRLDVTYQYDDTNLRVARDRTTTSQSVDNGILSPLVRATQGTTIVRLAKSERETMTIVPWFHDPSDIAQLFTPQLETRAAKHIGRSSIDTPEGTATGEEYRYTGGNYSGDDRFLLGRDGLLQAYTYNGFTIWRSTIDPATHGAEAAAAPS